MLTPAEDNGQPLHAGIINCPNPGCDCIVTWAATWHADGTLLGGDDAQRFIDDLRPRVIAERLRRRAARN
jgi:hypothetical protein